MGSGRTEAANLLFGSDRPDTGSMSVGGRAVTDFSPIASIKRGVVASVSRRNWKAARSVFQRPWFISTRKSRARKMRASALKMKEVALSA